MYLTLLALKLTCYILSGHVVLDLCAYDDGQFIKSIYMKNLSSKESAKVFSSLELRLKRFVMPLNTGTEVSDTHFIIVFQCFY